VCFCLFVLRYDQFHVLCILDVRNVKCMYVCRFILENISTRMFLPSVSRQFSWSAPVHYSLPFLQQFARHGAFPPTGLFWYCTMQFFFPISLDKGLMLCKYSTDSSGFNNFTSEINHGSCKKYLKVVYKCWQKCVPSEEHYFENLCLKAQILDLRYGSCPTTLKLPCMI
jgi:hypothetical protein